METITSGEGDIRIVSTHGNVNGGSLEVDVSAEVEPPGLRVQPPQRMIHLSPSGQPQPPPRMWGQQRNIMPGMSASIPSSTIITTATLTNPMPGQSSGEQTLYQKLLVTNQKLAQSTREKQAMKKHMDELSARLEKKELLLRKLVEENSRSVQRGQAAERRQSAQVAQSQMLQMSLNRMKEASASQTKVIEELTNTLDLLRSSPVKQPIVADSPESKKKAFDDLMMRKMRRMKNDNDDVEIIRPAKQEWCDNGVFVFRKGKEVNICIKLPIRVEMEGSKMKILEGDLASTNAENKRKRQEVAMQAVKLLANPKTEVLTVQRSQLLTLILLNKLLVGYGFKDAADSFKVGPDDRVVLRSSQVIKTYRPDLAAEARFSKMQTFISPGMQREKETREVEVIRFLRSLEELAKANPDTIAQTPEKKQQTTTILKPKGSCAPPNPLLVSAATGIERRVDHERRLFSAANWNAKNASILFQTLILNAQNVRMNVFYLPDYSVHNTVAFVPAMSVGSGKVAQIPFLIDLPAGQTASSPVASGSIVGFDYGVTVSNVDNVEKVTCALCRADYPASYMDIHLKKEHNIEEDPSLGPKPASDNNCEPKPPKGPFDDFTLWAVNVDQEKMERFGKPERLVLNIVPVTGNTRHLLKRLDSATVKSEPKDENTDSIVEKVKVGKERRNLDFRCRYCPRRFTSTLGWDAHLDSSHGDLQPFHCPFEGCTECFSNKSGVLQHMEFNCPRFRADGKVRDSEPETDEPPALVVQAPQEKTTQDTTVKTEESETTTIPDPTATADCNNSSSSKIINKRKQKRKRKHSTKTPLVSDGELNKSDDIEDIADSSATTSNVQVKTEPDDAEETGPAAAAAEGTRSARKSRRSAAAVGEDGATATAVAAAAMTTPKASTTAADELAGPKHSAENMAKRRKRNPQVSFTAIMKDVIIGCATFLKERIKLIRKDGSVHTKRTFNLREIEDKVDKDHYTTRAMLLQEFEEFCRRHIVVADHPEDTAVYGRLCEDMVKNCEDEVALRDETLEALEKEINPMLSDDKTVAFRHCLLKILDEDVKALRISHAFATRVSKSVIPDYYDIVKDPVCIEDIHSAVMYGEYKNKGDFLSDFRKMYKNSVAYNGKNDQLSKDALTIFNAVKASLKKYQQYVID